MGKFAQQNEARPLSRTYHCKCGGEMEGKGLFLPREICTTVGCGNASAKAATEYGNINGVGQKSAEVIVAEY